MTIPAQVRQAFFYITETFNFRVDLQPMLPLLFCTDLLIKLLNAPLPRIHVQGHLDGAEVVDGNPRKAELVIVFQELRTLKRAGTLASPQSLQK